MANRAALQANLDARFLHRDAEELRFAEPLERVMLVELRQSEDYAGYLAASGLLVVHRQVLTPNCAKPWDRCLEILKDKSCSCLATKYGTDFLACLEGFPSPWAGSATAHSVSELLVARMPDTSGDND
jgi:hypothetical protein